MNYDDVIDHLEALSNPKNVEGMAKFGINPKGTLGVSIPQIKALAVKLGKNHELAQKLWKSKIHEARILAALIDNPKQVTEEQMESWVKDFDSWDVCDQVCSNLFDKTPYALKKIDEWTLRSEEYVKRAGFVLIAVLAVHDKKMPDSVFSKYFELIKREASDDRNFVKKAVNWSLRQIGKRNKRLNVEAITFSKELLKLDSPSAKWIATDAIRELELKRQNF